MVVDIFLVYQFIRRLATPFEKWKAYEYGIIDKNGNILKKRRELRTVKERKAWGKFDLLVLKIKRLLEKVPGGKTRLASYAAALWLIKEGQEKNANMLTEEKLENDLINYIQYVQENYDQDILNEIFDNPYNYDFKFRKKYAVAKTKLPDNTQLEVEFIEGAKGKWEIYFDRDGVLELTNWGDQYKVFSTVLAAIKEFVEKKDPIRVSFSAEKSYGDSREKLYSSMIKRFSKKLGYKAESDYDDDEKITYFTLFKEEAPAVNVGGGHIAGVGVGPDGEPGVKRKEQEKYKKANRKKIIKRFANSVGEKKNGG